MINNLNIIKDNIFFSNDYCYILKMVLRKKENLDITNYKQSECSLTTRAIKNFNTLKESVELLIPICDKLNCRLYINLTPVYYKDFADKLKNDVNNLPDVCLYDLYGTNNSHDSDNNDINLIDIDKPELQLFPDIIKYIKEKKYDDVFYGPTVSGYHIVGKTEELDDIARHFKMSKPPCVQALFLVYTPLDRKVTE